MDLLGVARVIRRHSLITAFIALFTLAGMAAFYQLTPKQYQAAASYAFVSPTLPTAEQIQADKTLANVQAKNPYLNVGDVNTVVSIIAEQMSTDQIRDQVVSAGGDKNYTIQPSNADNSGGRLIAITGTGTSAPQALQTTRVVQSLMLNLLRNNQTQYGADTRYLVTAIPVTVPYQAKLAVSGKLRSVILIGVAGVIILFTMISFLEALRTRRLEEAAGIEPEYAGGAAPFERDVQPLPQRPATRPATLPARRSAPPPRRPAQPATADPAPFAAAVATQAQTPAPDPAPVAEVVPDPIVEREPTVEPAPAADVSAPAAAAPAVPARKPAKAAKAPAKRAPRSPSRPGKAGGATRLEATPAEPAETGEADDTLDLPWQQDEPAEPAEPPAQADPVAGPLPRRTAWTGRERAPREPARRR